MAELSVILVSFNDRQNLGLCLSSLFEAIRDIDAEIVVVDNHSTDGSAELIKQKFPRVKLIENSQNEGFAKACNKGLYQTSGAYVLFLNTDATINADALSLLLKEIRENPNVGGVGPALETGKGTFQVSFGKKVDFFSAFIQKAVLNPYFTRKLKKDGKKKDVGWLSAACLLTRREALEAAGFFDERFFIYFEDIDLCYRIRENGWKLIFLPCAKMIHIGGSTTSANRTLSRYHYRKSQLYFYRKHNTGASRFLLRLYLRGIFIFWAVLNSLGKKGVSVDSGDFLKLLKNG